ncbi:symporter small accessory protein [Parasulfuritortus cantonensis]|uniref:symporter small accessory protein n=1 Tax=Parasulfuritortus cantonensis TaxID=2528202 RepID=UPI0014047408|nr:symporter small accessory protein [Parasulfuritortus cantonensis]
MLGIDDPMIWLAYVACLVATALCVAYGLVRRNRAGDELTQEDRAWAVVDRQVEDEL